MTQYKHANVKLSNSQIYKLKSGTKNKTGINNTRTIIKYDGNDETNFPDKLLLPDRQVANLRQPFAKKIWANIKLSKTQLSKII